MELRRIEIEDLEYLREWRNTKAINKWCRQVGLISKLDQEKWYHKQNDDPTIKMFVICEQKPLGVCGLTDIDLINKRAEFSLYIGPEYQSRGLGKEALIRLFDFGFNELNLNLIWGETFEGNPASKLFEKIGMVKEGTRREFYYKDGKYLDTHLYSILEEDWLI